MYFGGNGQNNIRVIKLGNDMISTVGSAMSMSAPRFFEASFMHKYKGKYYFTYASDFSQGASKIEYMMSDKPTTGFQYKGYYCPSHPTTIVTIIIILSLSIWAIGMLCIQQDCGKTTWT